MLACCSALTSQQSPYAAVRDAAITTQVQSNPWPTPWWVPWPLTYLYVRNTIPTPRCSRGLGSAP